MSRIPYPLLLTTLLPLACGAPGEHTGADTGTFFRGDTAAVSYSQAITGQEPGDQHYGHLDDGRQVHVVRFRDEQGAHHALVVLSPNEHTPSRSPVGAPLVVLVPGLMAGTGPCGTAGPKSTFAPGLGIVGVMPLAAGVCCEGVCSAGQQDMAGQASRDGLQATWRFLRGDGTTTLGYDLATLVGRPLLRGPAVMLISSSSGHLAIPALAQDPRSFTGLEAVALYEVPTAPEMTARALGTTREDGNHRFDADRNGNPWDDRRNLDYQPGVCAGGACTLDLAALRWDPDLSLSRYAHGLPGLDHDAPGVFYLDRNGDGRLDLHPEHLDTDLDDDGALSPTEDFLFWGTFDTRYGADRYLHPPALLQAALDAEVLTAQAWPAHLAPLEETRSFWQERDVLGALPGLVSALPELRWLLVASVEDHGIPIGSRPHLSGTWQALDAAGARVIFEPSPASLCELAGGHVPPFQRLDWNEPLTEENILDHLVPEGFTSDQLRAASLTTMLDWLGELPGRGPRRASPP